MSKSKYIIGDADAANDMIVKGNDSPFANFSIGSNSNSLLNQFLAGDFKQLGKDASNNPTETIEAFLTGGLSEIGASTNLGHDLSSSKVNSDQQWNAKDPTKDYPLPADPSCQDLATLQQQLTTAQAGCQASYCQKVATYINQVTVLQNSMNCAQVLQAQQAALDTQEYSQAAQEALTATNPTVQAQTTTTGYFSPVTLALIGGGVVFMIVLYAIFGKKKMVVGAAPAVVPVK